MQCRWRSVPVASSARAQAGRVGDACRGRARCAERAALVRCGVRGTRGEHLCVKVAPTVSKGPRGRVIAARTVSPGSSTRIRCVFLKSEMAELGFTENLVTSCARTCP